MELYELVRRSVLVSGISQRATSREFGLNRRTVAKMVDNPVAPGYRASQPRKKPKLGGFEDAIERMLAQDEGPKQRHTAMHVPTEFVHLFRENSFTDSEVIRSAIPT